VRRRRELDRPDHGLRAGEDLDPSRTSSDRPIHAERRSSTGVGEARTVDEAYRQIAPPRIAAKIVSEIVSKIASKRTP
jgi:hypothetical protein